MTLPPIPAHEALHTKLCQLAARIEDDWLAFAEAALDAEEARVHVRYGYVDFGEYIQEEVGLSPRTLARRLQVARALRELPDGERDACRSALVALRGTKSSALAPALERKPDSWRDWVMRAEPLSSDALAEAVADALGTHRRVPGDPGSRFLAYILNAVPDEAREEVETAFKVAQRVGETANPVGAFLCMVHEFLATYSR